MNTDGFVPVKVTTTNATIQPPYLGLLNIVFVNLHDVVNELAEDQNGMVTYLGTYPAQLMSTIKFQPYSFYSHHISQYLHEYITNTSLCQILSERIALDCATLPQPFSVSFNVEVIREVRITLPSITVRSQVASRDVFKRLIDEQTVEPVDLDETCSICLENLSDTSSSESHQNRIIQMPKCLHSFHQNCIFEWLSRHNSCPLCRRVPYEEDDQD